jgi:arabinogalactan oligomer/maltooligosaccharide transport system substrate-binding protein
VNASVVTWAIATAIASAACAPPPSDGVVVWHAYNGLERDALETLADEWTRTHPDVPLHLVAVPYDAFADKLTSAIPNGNGPDLFIYSHDRIGDWALAGVVETIGYWVDDATAERFSDDAIRAMVFRGELYGLPMAVKSLALFYRTDRVDAPPRTTDDLEAMPRTPGVVPLAYAAVDLYGHAPWLHGMGGRVVDEDGAPTIATAEAARAANFVARLIDRGVIPGDASGAMVASMFNQGTAAMAMAGPWFVGDIDDGVPWRVTTLPTISETGLPAAPFLGAEGVLMSSRARDKTAAFRVMDYFTGDAAAIARARRARQVVPNRGAYDDAALAGDPVLGAFRAQLEHTIPMSAEPVMRLVWTPYKTALGDIFAGRATAAERLRDTQAEVERYARRPAR